MKCVIIGQGYVGLPIAMRAVAAGHDVVGYETNRHRLQNLTQGVSYVGDIDSSILEEALASGLYRATLNVEDCAAFDVAVMTVPTPLKDGMPDLSFVEDSAQQIGPYITNDCTVILESTTYPGTTTGLLVPLLEKESGLAAGPDFHVGYSPERLDPGNPSWTLQNTPKLVSGIDEASLKAVREFYETIVDVTVSVSNPDVAELSKVLENTFRHVNIALVNELAMFANDLGLDVWEAIKAASTKPFGFMPFTPGPGVGGHCLPVDPLYLSWRVKQALGTPFRFIELASDVNNHMPDYVIRRASAVLNRDKKALNGSRVLVLGLAYKRNSNDGRESPGPIICDKLRAFGADVVGVDPHLADDDFPSSIPRVQLTTEELSLADLVIIVTDHDIFDWDLIAQRAHRVLDTRHKLSPADHVELL